MSAQVKRRVSEIEDAIATGQMTAAQVFTQMRQLLAQPAGSGGDYVSVPRHDLLALLDCNLEAANIALGHYGNIDYIEENGGAEAEDDQIALSYHLYYGLHPAQRLRDILDAAAPASPQGSWQLVSTQHVPIADPMGSLGMPNAMLPMQYEIFDHYAATVSCRVKRGDALPPLPSSGDGRGVGA